MKKGCNEVIKAMERIDNFAFNDGIASASIVSLTDNKTEYSVIIDINRKQFYCDCIGFKSHKKPCKHILGLLLYLYNHDYISHDFLMEVDNECLKYLGGLKK